MDPMEVEGSAGAHTRPAQDDSASNQEVGVGIVFQPLDDGTLYVKRLKEGEPAARSGLIKVPSISTERDQKSSSSAVTDIVTPFVPPDRRLPLRNQRKGCLSKGRANTPPDAAASADSTRQQKRNMDPLPSDDAAARCLA